MNKYNILTLVALLAFLVVSPSEQKTECESKRESAQKMIRDIERAGTGSALAIVIPNCTPEGDYARLQCHHGSNLCSCWDKTGLPLTQPKKNLKKCTCLVDRALELQKVPPSQAVDAPVTNCEIDGNYTPKQCNRSSCWCVNPESGRKLGRESKDKNALKC